MDLTSTDTVRVRIPASPVYLRVVRLVVADLASRLGFTIDEIEDLKIGVDELVAYMTGSQGREGTLEIEFSVDQERIEINGKGHFLPGSRVRTELTDFSRTILETVTDSASLEQLDGTPIFNLVKTKSG
jgi:hypothetical protein